MMVKCLWWCLWVCELVGLLTLFTLGKVSGIQNVSIYWYDGLACLYKISGPASDKYRKISSGLFGRTSAWK